MPDVVVAGAGMAGLVAAAQAREEGAEVVVYEKGDRPGGAMRLSSGVIWRYRSLRAFRDHCPNGNQSLQELLHRRLDDDLDWLEGLGARPTERTTRNPATEGMRFEPDALTRALVDKAGEIRLSQPLAALPDRPTILATGGFQADTALVQTLITPEASKLVLRSTPWSTGDGLRLAMEAGATTTSALDEFYGRAMAVGRRRLRNDQFIALAQVYAYCARVESSTGEQFEGSDWSEIDVVRWLARQPGARARFRVARSDLGRPVPGGRTVGEAIAAAERAGVPVTRSRGRVEVEVVAGITSTLGGIAVDETGRAAPGLYAAGGDVGGFAGGVLQRSRGGARPRTHRSPRSAGVAMIDFAASEPFTVGIEEELLLVDADTLLLAPVAADVLARMAADGSAGHEIYAATIELRSNPSTTARAAVEDLMRLRERAWVAGATLLGAGIHPDGADGDAPRVELERYREVDAALRGLVRRTPECALHVHVGMPDLEAAVRALNGLRARLPLLQALAAASPLWFGRDSGLASSRAALVRSYPGRGIPRRFRDAADWRETVSRTLAAAELDDPTFLWWDVRINPRHGTVEVRELDAQSSLDTVAALAALIRALAFEAVNDSPTAADPDEALAWSAFRATRDGVDAQLLDRGSLRPVREIAADTVAAIAASAEELGDAACLDGIERILKRSGAAGTQRRAFAEHGMRGLLERVVAETMPGVRASGSSGRSGSFADAPGGASV